MSGAKKAQLQYSSDGGKDDVRGTTHAWLDQQIAAYSHFRQQHPDRRPARDDWQKLAKHGDVRVYMPRKGVWKTSPHFLAVGTIASPVSDCIFGMMTSTSDDKLLLMDYLGQPLSGASVLTVLDEPSRANPFRSMKVLKLVRETKGPIRNAINATEFVAVDATGIAMMPDGDRVAYCIMRSINAVSLPTMAKQLKCNELSTCVLFRRLSNTKTEFYLRAFVDCNTRNGLATSLACIDLARSYATLAKVGDVGKLRKLAWMLRDKTMHCPMDPERSQQVSLIKTCISCDAKATTLWHRRKLLCALCEFPVCAHCRIIKPNRVVAVNKFVHSYDVAICPGCWHTVSQADATEIAIKNVVHRASRNGSLYYTV